MPTCDHCGEPFGNAGALASHENACEPDDSDGKTAQPVQTPESATVPPNDGSTQAQPPAPAQQQPQQGGENLPAKNTEAALQTGMQAAELFSGLNSGDPHERANAKESGGAALAGFIHNMAQSSAERERKSAERARQAAGQELSPTYDPPTCGNCGEEIPPKYIPADSDVFNCPHCEIQLGAP